MKKERKAKLEEQKYTEIFNALFKVIAGSTQIDDIHNIPVCVYCGGESILEENNQWMSDHSEDCPIEKLRINFKLVCNALIAQVDKSLGGDKQ